MRVIAAFFGPYAPDALPAHVSVFSHDFKRFERLTKLATSSICASGGSVSKVEMAMFRTGCEFSVTPKLLAWAQVEVNRVIRARCGQKNGGTPWQHRERECA